MSKLHGETYISIKDSIIIVEVKGAFNIEGMERSFNDLKMVVDTFGQEEFKLLVDYTNSEGATPDAYEKNNEGNAWLNEKNMTAKAIVIKSNILLKILESRTPARKFQQAKNFDDKFDALAWLKLQ
jgi:HKD family nuclease